MRVLVACVALVLAAAPVAAEPSALERLLARTDAVAREVAKLRGLRLERPIPNEVVDRDELRRRLVAMANEPEARRETHAEGFALARWGMIPLTTDYGALLIDLLTQQIAGYYDPDTKKLTISKSAGDDPQWAELVLAHELQHGLQDQAYDLKKFEDLPSTEGDAAAARRALVEGDGVALMIEVMLVRRGIGAPWSNPMISSAIEGALAMTGNDGLDAAPLVVRESLMFPYRAGLGFVAALRRRKPWSAVDAAFVHPPRSTEQILHPDRYLAHDPPIAIAVDPIAALRGWTVVHDTVWGELGFSLFLRSHGVDAAAAAIAAAGWGGDRAVVLARPGEARPDRAVAIARVDWDTEVDAIEAEEAAIKAIDAAVTGAMLDERSAAPAGGGVGTATRWIAIDGTLSWVERRGRAVVIVHGAPAWAARALQAELWTAAHVATPAPRSRRRGRPAQPSK